MTSVYRNGASLQKRFFMFSFILVLLSITAAPVRADISLQNLQEGRLPPRTSAEYADICLATMWISLQNAKHDQDEKQFEDLYFTLFLAWTDAAFSFHNVKDFDAYSAIGAPYLARIRQLSEIEFKGLQVECMNHTPPFKEATK